MPASNCPRCGRLFNRIITSVCPACEKKDEEVFQKLRAYIEENPNCTITQASDATDVSHRRILMYIREGRLEMSKGMQDEVTCGKCGIPIQRGNYCEKCVVNMALELQDTYTYGEKKKHRMHIGSKRITGK